MTTTQHLEAITLASMLSADNTPLTIEDFYTAARRSARMTPDGLTVPTTLFEAMPITGRTAYLAFVELWKTELNTRAQEIRDARKSHRFWLREDLRSRCRVMHALRRASKLWAAAQWSANATAENPAT